MKKIKSLDLLNELLEDVKRMIEAGDFFKSAPPVKLSYQSHPEKWSVVQTIEHMNAYLRHYLPVIEKATAFKSKEVSAWFQPGFLGNYFTKSMRPTNVYEVKNKMRAMKSYSFPNSLNVEHVLQEFVELNERFVNIIELAKSRDINSIKIPITISRFIKLKLGDMIRFLVAHQQRHMVQARNTLHAMGIATDKFPVILQAAAL